VALVLVLMWAGSAPLIDSCLRRNGRPTLEERREPLRQTVADQVDSCLRRQPLSTSLTLATTEALRPQLTGQGNWGLERKGSPPDLGAPVPKSGLKKGFAGGGWRI
jgi:hypothetical protein